MKDDFINLSDFVVTTKYPIVRPNASFYVTVAFVVCCDDASIILKLVADFDYVAMLKARKLIPKIMACSI